MKASFSKFIVLLGIVPAFLVGCAKQAKNDNPFAHETVIYNNRGEQVNTNPTIDVSVKNGQEVSILPTEWMSLKDNFSDYKNAENYRVEGVENTTPKSVDITWTSESGALYYLVVLSLNQNMTDSSSIFRDEQSVSLKDLFAGSHYYYQIHAYYSDKTIISRRFDFKTVDFFRLISIDGVQNGRDLGNKKTTDGAKRIKQGLVYRTAYLDPVTEQGKAQAKVGYGIKTDLDLREPNYTTTPLGEGVNYVNNGVGNAGSPYYVNSDHGVNATAYQPAMRDNLKVFANMNNYPIVFHCAVGRDRTGTLAVVLELLCGVDMEQIKQDYIVYVFTSICNSTPVSTMAASFEALLNYFYSYGGYSDYYQGAEKYCLDIGVTSSEINTIRNILLEDVAL